MTKTHRYYFIVGKDLIILVLFLLAACSTARLEQARHISVMNDIDEEDSIVVLVRTNDVVDETEDSFVECLHDEFDGSIPLNVYPTQKFVDNLYPWFEPRTAPTNLQALTKLLERPGVREKIAQTHVRYLIWVSGDTNEVGKGGNITCTVTPAGGGCFGLMWWDKESTYEASIWDLQSAQSVGMASAEVTGTSYMPALIIPIPLIARTQNTACEGLVTQLKEVMGLTPD